MGMRVLARLATAATLVAVLACSSLGTCWLHFVGNGHSCCPQAAATLAASSKPCASAAVPVSSAVVAPPLAAPVYDLPAPQALFSGQRTDSAFAPALPVRSPPLILRI